MDYIELRCTISPYLQSTADMLIAELVDLGFEGFIETENGANAYIDKNLFVYEHLDKLHVNNDPQVKITFESVQVKNENWNARWEQNFTPVIIKNECTIRASFHSGIPKLKYDIIIEPKMSFGTGHHETTSMMMEEMLIRNFTGKTVLDIGCGTAVLAILASFRGAKKVVAIDNDPWAYENSLENIKANNVTNISAILGDFGNIPNHKFDFVLANITRNILLENMAVFYKVLKKSGYLLISGFLKQDVNIILDNFRKAGFSLVAMNEKNEWVGIVLIKNEAAVKSKYMSPNHP